MKVSSIIKIISECPVNLPGNDFEGLSLLYKSNFCKHTLASIAEDVFLEQIMNKQQL